MYANHNKSQIIYSITYNINISTVYIHCKQKIGFSIQSVILYIFSS